MSYRKIGAMVGASESAVRAWCSGRVPKGFFPQRKPVKSGVHPLTRKLFEEAQRQQINLNELAERAGLHSGAMWQWKRNGASPMIGCLDAAWKVLGYKLHVTPMDDD